MALPIYYSLASQVDKQRMFSNLFKYKKWADARTLEAIVKIDKMAYRTPYSFALQQLNHIIIVEDLFRARLEQKPAPHSNTNSNIVPEYDELKFRLAESGGWYQRYVSELETSKQTATISFRFADGKSGAMSVEEILFHIVNHGTYHRGSIAHALDLASVDHPVDGYGIFIHEEEPSRRTRR